MSKEKIKPNDEIEEFCFDDDDLIIIDDSFNTNLPAEHKQNLTKLFSKLTVAPFGEIFATPFNNEKTLITYAKLDYVNSGVTFDGKFDETHELIFELLVQLLAIIFRAAEIEKFRRVVLPLSSHEIYFR